MLKNNGLFGSMGRIGAAGDTRADRFTRLVAEQRARTRRSGKRARRCLPIVTWIERTYRRRLRKRSLGRMTPVEFEAVFHVVDEVECRGWTMRRQLSTLDSSAY